MARFARPTGVTGHDRVVCHMGMDDRSSARVRVVDATVRCIARAGLAKTTVDDVAREAGLSRATLYRLFPGGKEGMLRAVVETESARLFSDLAVVMGGAADMEDLLVEGIVAAARWLTAHEALGSLIEREPGTVLPYLAFGPMDRLLEVAGAFAAPFLGRWLEPDEAARTGEWAARIVLSYLACPGEGTDLADPAAVRHLVTTFVLPGVQALRFGRGGSEGKGGGHRMTPVRAGASARGKEHRRWATPA